MNASLLSILLLAGPVTDTNPSGQAGARAQAVARAQIVSGESIAFGEQFSRYSVTRNSDTSATIHLPLARSEQKKSEQNERTANIQEFY